MNSRRVKFLRRKTWIGKLLRIPFKLIPSKMILSIFRGPLKNKKWIKGSHNVSIPLGMYESKQTAAFIKLSRNSHTFWDIGCHVGYYSLLFNSVSPGGKIFAFEPVADTVNTFKTHMALNNITNFTVFPIAVSDKEGSYNFRKTTNSVAGKLDDSGETSVSVMKLSRMVLDKLIDIPDIIKMDIEGGEVTVLNDLKVLLREKMPYLFVSTHGAKIHQDCINILEDIGYRLNPLDTTNIQTSREFVAYK